MKIGVLSLQGDFSEHILMLQRLGVDAVEVRLPQHLEGLDGLIIPGGESTTIGKLAIDFGLLEPLRQFGQQHAIWGTCAGAILMAKEVGQEQPLLQVMDTIITRNAFGRQVDSFEEDLEIAGIEGGSFHGVFIRAPEVRSVGPNVKVLCRLADGRIVAAQQGRLLVTSFHPELTRDDRLHRYFLSLATSRDTQ